MIRRNLPVVGLLAIVFCNSVVLSQEPKGGDASPPKTLTVQQVAERARASVVIIRSPGREANEEGVGTGFVISKDGLIASNLHVVGEGRPLKVQTAAGRELAVVAVHASDHNLDLAILRVDPGDEELKPLVISRAGPPKDGSSVVAMGNPLGLKHSVVSGLVSGTRQVDQRTMLQLAMPVEPGNSGGPVLDTAGEVVGIVTLKSRLAENLGFAVSAADLNGLLSTPNPVPMARWLTIGQVDRRLWTLPQGGRWTQRGGRVQSRGGGDGFGGRTSCVWREPLGDERPYEIGVAVKMTEPSGAAGLLFHANDKGQHYGFYPSNGKLRLTRFDGPTVFTWKVLAEKPSDHYRVGDWNYLKVRLEKGKLSCYVNDELVIEERDETYTAGRFGLIAFRQTPAEFRQLQFKPQIARRQPTAKAREQIETLVSELPGGEQLRPTDLEPLLAASDTSREVLRRRAEELEREAAQLRAVADEVHVQQVVAEIRKLINQEKFDLLRGGLLLAQLDGEDVDVDAYLAEVDRMAAEVRASLKDGEADDPQRLAALNHYLFKENGYHGIRFDYYHRANSYLNRVIDDRVGLPITLSALYIALGERLDLKLEGVGMPGHFLVRFLPREQMPQLLDIYDGGKVLSRKDAAALALRTSGVVLTDEHLQAVDARQMLWRMLSNLRGLAEEKDDRSALLRYVEAGLVINEEDVSQRGIRAVLRFEAGRRAAALADLDWFLENQPPGVDLAQIRRMRTLFESAPIPRR